VWCVMSVSGRRGPCTNKPTSHTHIKRTHMCTKESRRQTLTHPSHRTPSRERCGSWWRGAWAAPAPRLGPMCMCLGGGGGVYVEGREEGRGGATAMCALRKATQTVYTWLTHPPTHMHTHTHTKHARVNMHTHLHPDDAPGGVLLVVQVLHAPCRVLLVDLRSRVEDHVPGWLAVGGWMDEGVCAGYVWGCLLEKTNK
jgi:hypothetical protein